MADDWISYYAFDSEFFWVRSSSKRRLSEVAIFAGASPKFGERLVDFVGKVTADRSSIGPRSGRSLLIQRHQFGLMNATNRLFNRLYRIALWMLVCLPLGMRAQTTPEIIRVQLEKTNILVTVRVPSGLRKVTLESRTRFSTGTWAPQRVARLDGSGGEWTFVLPRTVDLELLRVRADATEPFPASFYQGTNEFIGPPTSGGGRGEFFGAIDALPEDATGNGGDRAVVESDIWKIRGDNLYFFNQYRGLQVIDISQPDAPKLRGALSLPATGEQLYLMNDFAILLTRDCNMSPGKSTVLIVDTTAQPIQIVGRVEVEGTIQESRMVGSALYVASETYRPVNVVDPKLGNTWEWGTIVTSMDLSTPASPKLQGSLWYPGSGNVLTATDRYLFVSVRDPANWWHSQIHLIDISDAKGVMVRRGMVRPQGQVPDKFKMHLSGDIFTVVSETWSDRAQWTSVLETFDVVDPQTPARLGRVVIKAGERLFATRFDGARAYVVTFRQIDPLFVVDLSDPRNPKVAGELEVPGWSTYIQPLGDRLISIGIDNVNGWRVAVSLFDVKNPAAPALLSRVPVGENHSWSEANTDEKAFGIFPDLGLLLVPFQGDSTNGYVSRVQLIDLEGNRLVARGSVEHTLVPRRATVHRDRIVSISGRELLTLNAVNRDRPSVEGTLELSWRVDRVVATGNHLLEFSSANSWDTSHSLLRVVSGSDPEVVLRTTSLGSLPVLGSSTRDNTLYVLQGKSEWWWPADTSTEPKPPIETNLVLTTFDLTALPEIRVLGRTEIAAPPLGWSTDWRALWVRDGVIVWSGGGGYWNWWGRGGPVAIDALPAGGLWAPWFGGQGGRLMAFDVTDRQKPRLASDLNLTNNQRWNFSQAYHADGRVFFSHDSSEFLEGVVPLGFVPAPPVVTKDERCYHPNGFQGVRIGV